jgi:hypothetical protein
MFVYSLQPSLLSNLSPRYLSQFLVRPLWIAPFTTNTEKAEHLHPWEMSGTLCHAPRLFSNMSKTFALWEKIIQMQEKGKAGFSGKKGICQP